MGLTGLALGALLPERRERQKTTGSPPDGKPHFQPKAKRVIWLFMLGGVSHVESFDPKPALNKYAGKQLSETPHKDVLANPFAKENLKAFVPGQHEIKLTLYPMQTGLQAARKERRRCFRLVSAHGRHDARDFSHSLHVDDGQRSRSDPSVPHRAGTSSMAISRPSGRGFITDLGSLNENLPAFVVLGEPPGDCCGGVGTHGSGYLGPEHAGVYLRSRSGSAAAVRFARAGCLSRGAET